MPLKHTAFEVVTKSGIHGLVVDIPDATVVSYALYFNSGYSYVPFDAPDQTAHVLEHMLMGATTVEEYPTRHSLVRAMRRNGAYTNAFTNALGNWYLADSTADDVQRVLGLQWLVLNNPRLDKTNLRSESGNAQEEMRRNVGNNDRLAYEIAVRDLGTGVLTSEENIEDVGRVTLERIKTHFAYAYTRRNMRFIIAGDYRKYVQPALAVLDEAGLPEGKRLPDPRLTLKTGGSMSYVKRESLKSIYAKLTFGLRRRLSTKERQTMHILNQFLFIQSTSKVLGVAREQGICYSMNALMYMQFAGYSVWQIEAPIGSENAAKLFELIIDTFRELLKKGIDEDEFNAAKAFTLGNQRRGGQSPSALLDLYFDDYFYDQRVPDLVHFTEFDDISAVSALSLMQEFIDSDIWSLAGVGGVTADDFTEHYDRFAKFLKDR